MQQGRAEGAKQIVEQCRLAAERAVSLESGADLPLDPDDSLHGSYAQMRTRYLIDSGEWKSPVADWSLPPGHYPAARLTLEFGSGFAAVRRGDLKTAREALSALQTARRELEAILDRRSETERSYRQRGQIVEQQLQAMIWAAEGKNEEALRLLHQASGAEASMPFEFGPPLIDKPSDELLGELLVSLKRPAEARKAFEAALARAPARTASLLGLPRAVKAMGDHDAAKRVDAKLRQIWRRADHVPEEIH